MTRILIVGIGGVGGYFGGLLARAFQDSDTVQVSFLARGAHLEAIREHGLEVVKGEKTSTARPATATDDASGLDVMDYILLCTKTYDLEATIRSLQGCVRDDTVILPLLNGVDSKERIEQVYPRNLVCNGCAYIISRLTEPGRIENTGLVETLHFGVQDKDDPRLSRLEQLFREAGIEATCHMDILPVIWEKFIFISSVATSTSYYDMPTREILEEEERRTALNGLLREVYSLAKAKHIHVSEETIQEALDRLASLPLDATSSMHSDFTGGKRETELESLTGYVVQESRSYGLDTPFFDMMYAALKQRS